MSHFAAFTRWLHARLLSLYPRRFRQEFCEEMADVFGQAAEHAAGDGARPLLVLLARELRDWPGSCLREHLYERKLRAPQGRQGPVIGAWGAAAAALPFVLPAAALLLTPASGALFLSLPAAAIMMLGLAWYRHWPGWIASWLGVLIFPAQNWLPALLLGPGYFNQPVRTLASYSVDNALLPLFWYAILYLIVRRWPRHGVLAFLPFVIIPWAFYMEFASAAMSALVYGGSILLIAALAAAIALQRRPGGDVWLLYLATLLPGGLLTLGAIFVSPGMENAGQSFAGKVLEAIAPFAAILLLANVNAAAREAGRPARRAAWLLTVGLLVAFGALMALPRFVGPSFFEDRHIEITTVAAALWLGGLLLALWGAWRLYGRLAALTRRHFVVLALLLLTLPFLQYPSYLSFQVGSLTYRQRTLAHLRELLPSLAIADAVISVLGAAALLCLPFMIVHLRRHTSAAATGTAASASLTGEAASASPTGEAAAGASAPATRSPRSRRRPYLVVAALALLIAAGAFFALVFLPLQLEAEPYTSQLALGDLDGDGDLDAALANTRRLLPTADNRLLLNDGAGAFSASGLDVGQGGTDVALLDANGDGRLDVLFGGMAGVLLYGEVDGRWRQLGVGGMPPSPGSGASQFYLAIGDLNGDGYPDVFAAACCGTGVSNYPHPMTWNPPANRVLFGQENGLTGSGQALGHHGSQAVALGDLDGDGSLDAFVANSRTSGEPPQGDAPNEVWLNAGDGFFRDSGQLLGRQRSHAVALGDVDGDGDLDALVGNEGADELWLNDGQGRFSLAPQSWSKRRTLQAFLVDLDGDGDLDAATVHELATSFAWYRQAIIWWNDGDGSFSQESRRIRLRPNAAVAIGDVTGDGRPNIVSGAVDTVTIHFP